MLKNFSEKNFYVKRDKTQIVLKIFIRAFRTVFVGVGPSLNKIFFLGDVSRLRGTCFHYSLGINPFLCSIIKSYKIIKIHLK